MASVAVRAQTDPYLVAGGERGRRVGEPLSGQFSKRSIRSTVNARMPNIKWHSALA